MGQLNGRNLHEVEKVTGFTAEGHDFGSNGCHKFQGDGLATVGVVAVDSTTSWLNLMSDRNGFGAIVIDRQCKRLEKEGWFNCSIERAYGYIKYLVKRAVLPAGQHARAAPEEVKRVNALLICHRRKAGPC